MCLVRPTQFFFGVGVYWSHKRRLLSCILRTTSNPSLNNESTTDQSETVVLETVKPHVTGRSQPMKNDFEFRPKGQIFGIMREPKRCFLCVKTQACCVNARRDWVLAAAWFKFLALEHSQKDEERLGVNKPLASFLFYLWATGSKLFCLVEWPVVVIADFVGILYRLNSILV